MTRAPATLSMLLAACLVFGACSSEPEPRAPRKGDASPLLFDFTKQPERKEGEPVDPATCKHDWQPSRTHSHPYQTMVNGMPMTRHCFAQQCSICKTVRHECERVRKQQQLQQQRRRRR